MPRSFTIVTRSHHPPERLFDHARDIGEHVASLAHTRERAIAGVTEGRIGLGETVTWQGRHFGVRFTMTSRVTAFDAPHRFVDEQIRGPFRSLRHEHRFEADGAGTIMTDTVTLASPLLGFAVEPLLLVPHLRRIVVRRNAFLLASLDDGARAGAARPTPGIRPRRGWRAGR